MRVLLTGANGLLGRSIQNYNSGIDILAFGRDELDISVKEEIEKAIRAYQPDWLINSAAATDVDRCEKDIAWACSVNARGPRLLAESCKGRCGFLHISTDFVFAGDKGSPYLESDKPQPINVYGASKRLGECAVIDHGGVVLRTQWLYARHRKGFVDWVLDDSKEPISVIEDCYGCPTNAEDLAACALDLIATEANGIYHVANSGVCSRADFAEAILERAKIKKTIKRVRQSDLRLPARRPRYSALASERGINMRPWQEALDAYFARIR